MVLQSATATCELATGTSRQRRVMSQLPEMGCPSLVAPYSTSRTLRGRVVASVLRK